MKSKIITPLVFAGLASLFAHTMSAQYCPGNPENASSFDWTADNWSVWVRPVVTQVPVQLQLPSPYHPNTALGQPNTQHLHAASGMGDYRPEDGWVLISESMGLSLEQATAFPQFVLYNRFESKLRYFVYVAGFPNLRDLEIRTYFSSINTSHVSAALEHAFTPMNVLEGYRDKEILITVPNKGIQSGVWAMADIPIAYDPCTCQYPSALEITIRSRSYPTFNFTFHGGGETKQVIGSETAGSVSSVLNEGYRFANVTGRIEPGTYTGVSTYKAAGELRLMAQKLLVNYANRKLTPPLTAQLNTIPGITIDPAIGITSAHVNLLGAAPHLLPAQADAVRQLFPQKLPASLTPDWFKSAAPFPGASFSLLDFVIGGGKRTVQPMHFNSDFKFIGTGTTAVAQNLTGLSIYTPGSNFAYQASVARRPRYNRIMGILNLIEQPKLWLASSGAATITTPDGAVFYGHESLSLHLSAPLKYALNPASDMNIEDIRAALYFKVPDQWLTPDGALVTPASAGLVEDEPGIWRTAYMPLACLASYSIKFPPMLPRSPFPLWEDSPYCFICGDIQLHLVVKLTSPAGKETAWAARYRVNTTPAPYTYENTPPNPYSQVSENAIISSVEDIIGENFQCWNPIEITSDLVVTQDAVERFFNNLPPRAVTTVDGMRIEQFFAGQVIKAPFTIDLSPDCGPSPPADAAWLQSFCGNRSRYNPVMSFGLQEENPRITDKNLNLSISPNPTGDATLLKYNLLDAGPVSIVLSDYTGRRVAELHAAVEQAQGEYQLLIPLERYAPGIYVVTVTRPSGKDSVRVVKY